MKTKIKTPIQFLREGDIITNLLIFGFEHDSEFKITSIKLFISEDEEEIYRVKITDYPDFENIEAIWIEPDTELTRVKI